MDSSKDKVVVAGSRDIEVAVTLMRLAMPLLDRAGELRTAAEMQRMIEDLHAMR